MQKISVIFKPSYLWNNIFFNMQKNIIYSEKNKISYIYKVLSSYLPLNYCKSFNLFTNDKNENENNNIFDNIEEPWRICRDVEPHNLQNAVEIINEETILNKVSDYDEFYDYIDNTYMLNIYRNIDDTDDNYFSSGKLFIDKKIRDREAIINLSDKSLIFYDNKKLTCNLSDNNEKKFSKNNSFSKKIVYDKNKKLVSINNRKVYTNNLKYRKIYIFEKSEFF